jgi:hypothetical protein
MEPSYDPPRIDRGSRRDRPQRLTCPPWTGMKSGAGEGWKRSGVIGPCKVGRDNRGLPRDGADSQDHSQDAVSVAPGATVGPM